MTAPTTARPLQLPAQSRPQHRSQTTMVEQQRAIAEVQAAVVVAQGNPRDMRRAEADMYDVCGRMSMANFAFYAVKNRGTGASVHLLRELARIWGNVQFGVNELSRSDELGESEVQAWAWDLQTNTRSSRTFIVPHARMKDGQRQALIDLQDIYLNNQNIGARAVRECIETILPRWFVEEAQIACRSTLEDGEGKPLPQRIDEMVAGFAAIGITERQIEERLDKLRGAWDAGDVAQMGITYRSITQEGLRKSEAFEPDPGAAPTELAAPAPAGEKRTLKTQSARKAEPAQQKPADSAAKPDAAAEPKAAVKETPPLTAKARQQLIESLIGFLARGKVEDRVDQRRVIAQLGGLDVLPDENNELSDDALRRVVAALAQHAEVATSAKSKGADPDEVMAERLGAVIAEWRDSAADGKTQDGQS